MKKVLVVFIILFMSCTNSATSELATEEQKNWCFGQQVKFVNSLEIWGGMNGIFYDNIRGATFESKSFTYDYVIRSQAAYDLFKAKYNKPPVSEYYFEQIEIDISGLTLIGDPANAENGDELTIDDFSDDGYTIANFQAESLQLAILDENTEALQYCKIFYEVSIEE